MTLVLIASQPNGTIQDSRGDARTGPATFLDEDGNPATHYADAAGTGASTAAITADGLGRLMRWIAPGEYTISVGGTELEFHAVPGGFNAAEPASAVLSTTAPFITGRYRLRDRWAAGDFGAKFNGDDETTELQEGVHETRSAGRTLWLPEGVSAASAALTDSGDNELPVSIRGAGMDLTTIERDYSSPLFSISGALTSGISETITVAAAAGTSALTITDTTGLAADDVVVLRDDTQVIYGDDTRVAYSCVGEVVQIKSVDSGTTLTLRAPLEYSYTTSGNLRFPRAVNGVTFADFTIENTTPGTAVNSSAHDIDITYSTKVRISDMGFINPDGTSLYLQYVYGFQVTGANFRNAQDDPGSVRTPYNIALKGWTTHGQILGCQGRFGRHMVTTLASSSPNEPPASHVLVANCIGTEYNQTTFDTHPGSRKITFANCESHHGNSSGFKLRGPDQTVINPIVTGHYLGEGVRFVYGADRARVLGGRLSGCEIGVMVDSSDDCYIGQGLLIENPVTHGIQVVCEAAWDAYMTKLAIDDVDITGTPSTAGVDFTDKWNDNFRVERVRVPDATTKFTGAPLAAVAQTPIGLPGFITPQVILGQTSTVATASRAYINRVYLEEPCTISAIGFSVGTASATNDECCVAVLDATGTRVATSGAVTGKLNAGAGIKSVALAYTFKPKTVYYLAFSYGTSAAPAALALASQTGANTDIQFPFGATPPNALFGIKAASHPIPTSITTPAAGSTVILFGIK